MTKGTGPIPTANELEKLLNRVQLRGRDNVRHECQDSDTSKSDHVGIQAKTDTKQRYECSSGGDAQKASTAEPLSKYLSDASSMQRVAVPHLDEEDGRSCHDEVDDCDTKRYVGTKVGKGCREDIIAVVQHWRMFRRPALYLPDQQITCIDT